MLWHASSPVSLMVDICSHTSWPALEMDTEYILSNSHSYNTSRNNDSLKGKHHFRKKEEKE